MDADAVPDQFLDLLAVGLRKIRAHQRRRDRFLLLLRAVVAAHQILRGLGAGELGEVDEVDRGAVLLHEFLDHFLEGELVVVVELERHGPLRRFHEHGFGSGEARQFLFEKGGVAERGGHEEESRPRQGQQRDLPGHAALVVRVIMELVHDDVVDRGGGPLAQGVVREDLGGAADHGSRGFTVASPVIMPTLSGPKTSQRARNFSFASAFTGTV